jgi:hypothetical protein
MTGSCGETEFFFGYKLHLSAINTKYRPIPAAARLAPANYADLELARDLINEAYDMHNRVLGVAPRYYLMDAGYDAEYVYLQP